MPPRSSCVPAEAELDCLQRRIAAECAKHGLVNENEAALAELSQQAIQAEQKTKLLSSQSAVLAAELTLATAEAKPEKYAERDKEISAAAEQLGKAKQNLTKANAESAADFFSPLSPTYPKTSTGRRRALAQWITSPDNPLTARVAVNHIWSHHFHRPLVETVYDFGRNAEQPVQRDLLDWLAVELIESDWSMKHIHRLITNSYAYQRSSKVHADRPDTASQLDPENELLWRMNTGRMEAEVLRDSLLYCGGLLESKSGGRPLENNLALKTYRRSLYYEVYPEDGGTNEFSSLFDPPSPIECYRRTRSVVPQQALALTNSELVHDISKRIVADSAADLSDQAFVTITFAKILNRRPTDQELRLCIDAMRNRIDLSEHSDRKQSQIDARESLVRVLLNHNDFVTVR